MATPTRSRPSALPGRIPTPARARSLSRSSSHAGVHPSSSTTSADSDFANRALEDALKSNDPSKFGAPPRPPSVLSSTVSSRAKTPSRARPPSRQSDAFATRASDAFPRSTSRASEQFEVGDPVRIASLGFEGVLRYIGEIGGKPGLWAGVELDGGFAGQGKNNGTVNGKVYFTCPPNCGVFVSTTKLSVPVVRRPSSVVSSVSGRATPAFSTGRTTPSLAASRTGRTTPSGRVTPASSRARRPTLSKSTVKTPVRAAPTPKPPLSSGSRASKYASMTAQQLSMRDQSPYFHQGSPTRTSSQYTSSPSASPFKTPKPRFVGRMHVPASPTAGKGQDSIGRARIPSAIAMPPPASHNSISHSISMQGQLSDSGRDLSLTELQRSGKLLQERLSSLSSAGPFHSSSPHGTALSSSTTSFMSASRPSSVSSVHSSVADDHQLEMERLQSRIDALEYANERLRASSKEDSAHAGDMATMQESLDAATGRIAELEQQLLEAIAQSSSRDESLPKENGDVVASSNEELLQTIETQRLRIIDLETQLEDVQTNARSSEARVESDLEEERRRVQGKQEELERAQAELQESLTKADAIREELEGHVSRMSVLEAQLSDVRMKLSEEQALREHSQIELEEERRELGAQVDELRKAGQETIALYEERLSELDTQRYDLERRLSQAQSSVASADKEAAHQRSASARVTAAEIDNEALREQVHHLQQKIVSMEDAMEDSRLAIEREDEVFSEKMRRLREKEDIMRKEMVETRKETDRLSKSEALARRRIEEVEEALRESTAALENAQAEVEGLRTELSNMESVVASASGSQLARSTIKSADKSVNEDSFRDMQNELQSLRRSLDDKNHELEALQKKLNREVPINNGVSEPSSSKASNKEVTGLKHIVQQLQQEILAAEQRQKMLESENELLTSELKQLREEIKILEENMDKEDLSAADAISPNPATTDVETLQRTVREQKARYEAELEQLRKRQSDLELKNARTVHDLNKEIGELEALIEAKIYREDELEQELERTKDKLARHKKSSKSSSDIMQDSKHSKTASTASASSTQTAAADEPVCEICERPGHDIFNCDLLKEDPHESSSHPSSKDLWCQDCEMLGHTTADCPHSQDVF